MMALGLLALDIVSIQHHWNLTLPKVSYDNLSTPLKVDTILIYRDLSLVSSFATRSRVCNSGSFFQSNACHLFFAWDLAAVCTIGMSILASLRKQPTFGNTSAGFPTKWCLRNSILMTRHYPDLGGASDWSCCMGNLIQPIRSTTQIWVVTHHQYLISVLLSLTKCPLFSQKGYIMARCLQDKSWL